MAPRGLRLVRVGRYAGTVLRAVLLVALLLPLLLVALLSLNAVAGFTFTPAMQTLDPAGYSLRWYRALATEPAWRGAFANSLLVAGAATALALVLGLPAAWGLRQAEPSWRRRLLVFACAPLFVPAVALATGMNGFYARLGLAHGRGGMILALAVTVLPLVLALALWTFRRLDHSEIQAAASLGADPATRLLRVVLPAVGPGVAGAAALAFVVALDEIALMVFLAPAGAATLSLQSLDAWQIDASPAVLALATLAMLAAGLLWLVGELIFRWRDRLQNRIPERG